MPPITVRRLKNSRSLKLRIRDDGEIIVTAPLEIGQDIIENFIDRHRFWIKKKVDYIAKIQHSLTTKRQKLLFRGRDYHLRLSVAPSKEPAAKFENDTLLITATSENHYEIRQIIEKLYRREAAKYFGERVPLLSDLVGKDLRRINVRSQRTRWGSCSTNKTISLNWRLVMAPDWVSDYIIYHELAHLTHMNHSRDFWRLVADYYPKYKEAESWLKKHHILLKF